VSDPTFWLEARASGLLAYVLLTCSVLAGLLLKSRPFGATPRPAAVTDSHRLLALLALSATAVHGTALVLDRTVTITVTDLLVPGMIPYRPLWTGTGVVAGELMVVVYLSFSQRKRIGVANWRRLHWATYGVFAAMVVHGAASGTDTKEAWVRGLYAVTVGLVAAAAFWRGAVPPRRAARRVTHAAAEAP